MTCGRLVVLASLDDVFRNLEILSNVEIGDKLVHDDRFLHKDASYLQAITRTFMKMSRWKTVQFIKNVVDNANKYLLILSKSTDDASTMNHLRLITDLKHSIVGLTKMKQTYSADKEIHIEIDIVIRDINKLFEK
ncbi:MAG: hypothetical protein Gaeavirus13_1 [Gaeavirus sp.]|uniref:Uncharacterized protein n=1 Tax=Gaeavirus sp. TaxID=2487767 RepID=A0A3G5A3W9_9VIRU|nr:MAG: hypothetical protein Gaeavirus13_1 [Gaeavirus sp.]